MHREKCLAVNVHALIVYKGLFHDNIAKKIIHTFPQIKSISSISSKLNVKCNRININSCPGRSVPISPRLREAFWDIPVADRINHSLVKKLINDLSMKKY